MTYDVAIIGAGSAGLSARREVAKITDNYIVIDDGPLGTTCARVGCMPSKALIQVANDYHRRLSLPREGIRGGESLWLDDAAVMAHVRALRDRFVRSVMRDVKQMQDKLLRGRARFVSPTELSVRTQDGEQRITAKRSVVAAGSKPIIPQAWRDVSELLIDTDGLFELERLPRRVAVIGLGVIGLELGQALHRLGVSVHAVTLDKALGGLTDPALQQEAFELLSQELPVTMAPVERVERSGDGLHVHAGGDTLEVDRAFVAMGRRPMTGELGLAEIGAPLDDAGRPRFHPQSFQLGELPIYLVGDANAHRPVLHETSDEGRIAGYNAVREQAQYFKRRTPLMITFSEPNLAIVGASHAELTSRGTRFVTGEISYRGQGRAIIKGQEHGLLHVYAASDSGRLLGAELAAPGGEHLAHLLAWAIAADMTAKDALSMPFYHPVLEEGLRSALRDAARKAQLPLGELDLMRCEDPPVGCFS